MGLLAQFVRTVKGWFGGGRILCDTCRYDYGDVCRNPQRPNATKCKDYKGR